MNAKFLLRVLPSLFFVAAVVSISAAQTLPWVLPFSNASASAQTNFLQTYNNRLTPATSGAGISYITFTDRRGYTYVTTASINNINVISPLTYAQVATITNSATAAINNPVGMAASPDGNTLYVTNYSNNTGTNSVGVFNISTPGTITAVKNISFSTACNCQFNGSPGWMDMDNAGNLYIAVSSSNTTPYWVKVTDPNGAATVTWYTTNANYNGSASYNLGSTHTIAVDKIHNLVYVASDNGSPIQAWSTAGVAQNVVYQPSAGVHGLTLSPDGTTLYAANYGGTINRFNTTTTGLPRTAGATGNVVSPANTVTPVVGGGSQRIAAITPDGAKLYALEYYNIRQLNPTTLTTIATVPGTFSQIDPHSNSFSLMDFGDAPASYGTAGHSLNNTNYLNNLLHIGVKVDPDTTNISNSATANFDDNSNPIAGVTDDEDAFATKPAPVTGSTYAASIPVTNNTGGNVNLVAWIDFNLDGDFADAGESSALVTVPNGATTAIVSFSGYARAITGTTFMRIRLSSDAALTATAAAARDLVFKDGEVEDFQIDLTSIIDPDFNATYVGITTPGNIATNNVVPTGSTYSTPASSVSQPSGSSYTLSVNADGTYNFSGNTPGTYVFDVPVCPPGVSTGCPVNRLSITVADASATSNPPVAAPDLASTNAGSPVTLKTLANDQPGANSSALNPASVTITTNPANGTASVNPTTGDITYTPNPGFVGTDTIRYSACDQATPTPRCTQSYQVITVNPAGTNNTSASDDYNTTLAGVNATGNVLTNDVDAQGNTQTVAPITQTIPGKGTVTINADGSYTFVPVAGFTGPINFPYTVCDNGTPQACDNASLYILVTPIPAATLSGTLFNDNNGQAGGPNGTPLPGTIVTLYASDGVTIIATDTTDASGNYSFPGQLPGNYVVGVTPPASFLNVSSTDATPTNGLTSITAGSTGLTGINFGLNEPPTANTSAASSSTPPPGTVSVPVAPAGFGGTDSNGGIIDSLRITGFPTNTTSIGIGDITYYPDVASVPAGCTTCAAFPPGGVTVPTTTNGQPTVVLSVDPSGTTATTVVIPYTVIDNAGLQDATPGSLTLPFNTPLPVKWLSFTATTSGKDVLLDWATAMEENTDHFEAEYATDGSHFHKLGQVAAAGNSAMTRSYSFKHSNAAGLGVPVLRYRIRQVDHDGLYTYSEVRNVRLNTSGQTSVRVYPNPVSPGTGLTVIAEGIREVQVTNAAGSSIWSGRYKGESMVTIPIGNWASGTYLVRINSDQVVKFVVK